MPETSRPDSTDSAARPGPAEWVLIVIGSALLLANILNSRPLLSANDRSRWSTVWSLVERGTYQIDEIDARPGWTTIDKVLHEGHLYSTKPPLLSTATAGTYWLVKQSTGLDLLRQTDDATRLILVLVNWLPLTLAFIVLARMLARSSGSVPARLAALGTFCFGTLVTSYATVLNNHSMAAVCAVFALAPLLRVVNEENARGQDFAQVGFWGALLACCELPAALFGLLLFALLCRKSVSRTAIWFVPAALIPLGAYFVTNWIATGGWKPFYLYYGTEKYLFELDGIRSYWHEPRGMDQSLDSPFTYFVHCTIGHHGIYSLSPIFLLAIITWCRRSWWEYSRLTPAIWSGLALTIAVLGFYLTRTQNYNYGGNTFGLRWMVWLVPFWTLSLVPSLEQFSVHRWKQIAVLCLLAGSVFSSVSAARNPWASSWLFDQMEQAGWIDYSNPPPDLPFDRPLRTVFADLPDEDGAWVEYESSDRSGSLNARRPDVLRLSNEGRSSESGRRIQFLRFEWNRGRPDAWTLVVQIDVAAFEAGQPVDQQLVSFQSAHHSRPDVLTLLRGVPGDRPYVAQTRRHVRTPLRKNAFRCFRAATQVRFGNDDASTLRRCELWLTDELPFGVVQFDLTESDARTRELLSKRRFVVRATSALERLDADAREVLRLRDNHKRRGAANPLDDPGLRMKLFGHTDLVHAVAFSSDGKLIASGSADRTIRLWNARTGVTRFIMSGHTSRVRNVAFSPDGSRVASGSEDGTVRVWDTVTGQETLTFKGHLPSFHTHLGFSEDGHRIVSAGRNRPDHVSTIHVWDVNTGDRHLTLYPGGATIRSLSLDPLGKRIAFCTHDDRVQAIHVWNLETGTELTKLIAADSGDLTVLLRPSEMLKCVAFSPDGSQIASAGKRVELWDVKSGNVTRTMPAGKYGAKFVAFSPNGDRLVSFGDDRVVHLWNPETGAEIHQWKSSPLVAAFSPDGRVLATGSGHTISLWDDPWRIRKPPG